MDRPTEALSAYAAELSHADLTPEAVHGMKRRLVDSVACALGGFAGEPSRIARELARREIGSPPARVLFTSEATTPALAAFANTMMVRYLDCNDIYRVKEGGHPSDTIGAVLAAADAVGAPGREALLGMVVGYEVMAALSEMEDLGPHGLDHTLHTTIASALGAGKVLGLDRERMAHALSIALTPNVTLRVNRAGRLSMWKGAAAANAARNGLFAAQAAALGMTGPSDPFEGKDGLKQLTGESTEVPPLGGRGQDFHTHRTAMKYFPSDYHGQAPIFAALDIRREVPLDDIARITAHMYEFGYHEIGEGEAKWQARDRETADHSLPYLLSVALLDGDVGPAQFTPERLADPRVHELMGKVAVELDEELTRRFADGEVATRIEVTTRNGATKTFVVESPKGHVRNPFTDDDLNAKFRRFADALMPRAAQARALDTLWRFEELDSLDELFEALQV